MSHEPNKKTAGSISLPEIPGNWKSRWTFDNLLIC